MDEETELQSMTTQNDATAENLATNIHKDLATYRSILENKIEQVDCRPHMYTVRSEKWKICKCGRPESWSGHMSEEDLTRSSFKKEDHCNAVECKSYGELSFEGFGAQLRTPAQYIRVDAKTNPAHLWEIMKDCWHPHPPKLIISVTGGAFCNMKSRLIASFKRGLTNAATTTDAWIVTGGTNTGVMKFVGEAVREHTMLTAEPVVAVGIVTWGIIDNKECLTDRPGKRAAYKKKDLGLNNNIWVSPLDPNHSHFILVDNGIEREFGLEIDLRAEFEAYVSTHALPDSKDNHVPVVSLVLGGGINTIITAAKSCEQGTPIVVVKESGRAADLIALAFNEATKKNRDDDQGELPENFDVLVKEEAKRIMESQNERELANIIENIRRLVMKKNMITVFSLADDNTKEMDKAILFGLLKAKRANPESQLNLALAWDCADIAHDELFTAQNGPKHTDHLTEAMTKALLQDKPAFVKLFLDNGVVLSDFLTEDRLLELYNKVTETAGTVFLKDLINEGGHHDSIDFDMVDKLIGKQTGGIHFYKGHPKSERGLMEPVRDLLLWAVLYNRQELALLFWKLGKDQIGGALFASSILMALSVEARKREEVDLSLEMEANANAFEHLAICVLNECDKRDRSKSHELLTRELDTWGKTTLFQLADRGNLMDFMGHSSCQSKLNKIWKGKMALYTSSWKILIGLIMPLMVLSIKFTRNTATSKTASQNYKYAVQGDKKNKVKKLYTTTLVRVKKDESRTVHFLTALYLYHSAPMVKFCYHTLLYVGYLGYFSFFVLTDLRHDTISVHEYIIWAWSFTLIMDECRQLYVEKTAYFESRWNNFDCVIFLFLILSIVLRYALSEDYFEWARMSYVLTLVLLYLRSMQLFFVWKNIGPKVIMIRRMMTDLGFFLLILVTVIFAYGIARHALLFPNTTGSFLEILSSVVSQPFWGIYGELFLEDFEGEVEGCSDNATLYENNPDVSRCPTPSRMATALLAVYMLLTNVLLINLLIAMFSHTFERVQAKSEQVWCFHRYGLIYEYFDKPTLAPPLIIVCHLWRLLKLLIGCTHCRDASPERNDFCESSENNDALTVFERAGMENYLHQKHGTGMIDNSSKVSTTKKNFHLPTVTTNNDMVTEKNSE